MISSRYLAWAASTASECADFWHAFPKVLEELYYLFVILLIDDKRIRQKSISVHTRTDLN